jgi:hypothetical protein
MTRINYRSAKWLHLRVPGYILCSMLATGMFFNALSAYAQTNLLLNAGFEEAADNTGSAPHWSTAAGSGGKPQLAEQAPHGGRQALTIPARTAVEQKVASAKAGAYVARAWVMSPIEQPVTLLVQDANQPWVGYSCAEIRVPGNQWAQVETFCSLEKDGSLTFALGELPADFRQYHGTSAQLRNAITVDDIELFRYEPKSASGPLRVLEVKQGSVDWSKRSQWSEAQTSDNAIAGTGVIQSQRLLGAVRASDGSLEISSIQGDQLKPRCTLVPSIPIPNAKSSLVTERNRKGLRVGSEKGDRSYTAWFTPEGLVSVAAYGIPQFQVKDCRLRYGLLPSFVGTDICYASERMQGANQFRLPSTQWLVGLVDGNDSMLVAVWESDAQAASLGLAGEGENCLIDSLTIDTAKAGFSLSLVEHANIWHKEALKEDWLGQYVPIAWERPFPARWMGQFFVTPAIKPTFREPCMDYSFPIAGARTRQYGVWFEDWNRYPFYFDGPRTIFHFEKTFVPNGDALIYFLEPAAADLYSPCEIVEQALGREKALALFDFDANRLRKLNYSTPDEFQYDRPVCATSDRLAAIRPGEKATVGVILATHVYEFIREIRGRVDQYNSFFTRTQDYLASEKKAHPELREYLDEMAAMLTEGQNEAKIIYATNLSSVQTKTDAMKKRLLEETGNGFNFGELDCRTTAGWQDDLCRRCNRMVMRLVQTAALKCGDSAEKAQVAKHIWDDSRDVLRQPTRWESRRSLYFFEP